jgi:hypothetical protein
MEVLKFINKNRKLDYEDIVNILEKEYNLEVRLDKSNNYYMVSVTNNSNFNYKFIRQCTGIIIEKESNKVIHYFGEKTYGFDNNKVKLEDINIKSCLIAPYINGYIIKIFNYKEEWNFATSKHTNIKIFKINDKTLYKMFEETIKNTFESLEDFLSILDKSYCYSFMLSDNKLHMINKIFLDTFEEYYNFNNFSSLFDIKYNFEKYLLIEKNYNNVVCKKIIVSDKDIKDYIYVNKTCNLVYSIKPNIDTNYKNYIISQKKKNPMFKSKKCD